MKTPPRRKRKPRRVITKVMVFCALFVDFVGEDPQSEPKREGE